MTDNRETLEPCPFCGGEARIAPETVSWAAHEMWVAICPVCGGRGGLNDTEAEAIAAWNNRPSLEAARIEGARAMREAIVAWLRDTPFGADDLDDASAVLAEAIRSLDPAVEQ